MRYVLLSCLAVVFSLFTVHSPASLHIQGKVTDDKGNAITGVAINEKGTQTGTTTDANGVFNITVNSAKPVLIFSAVGFDKKEISVQGKTTINVIMKTTSQNLDEVVVIGYGTGSAEYEHSSGKKVKAPAGVLARRDNFYQPLQSRVADLSVTNWSNKDMRAQKGKTGMSIQMIKILTPKITMALQKTGFFP